ncbi:hypothetical protein M153_14900010945 [Pseudoloma neurophilia]|uniref:Uncharacterized protein n=1 Tax=Pseudoloma neurophilia TaxID=146866 RepID=A0A0R0M5U8_9MICR|nr:hypothetical protein M153_14900010945 [Pseudoloma neurophilia]
MKKLYFLFLNLLNVVFCLRLLKLRGKENFIIRMNGKNELELYDYFSPHRRAGMIKNKSLKEEVERVVKESPVIIKQRILYFLIHEDLYDVTMKQGDVQAVGSKSNKKYDKIVPSHNIVGFTHRNNDISRIDTLNSSKWQSDHETNFFKKNNTTKRDDHRSTFLNSMNEKHEVLAFAHDATSDMPKMNFKLPTQKKAKEPDRTYSSAKYTNMFKKKVPKDGDSLKSSELLPRKVEEIARPFDILKKPPPLPAPNYGEEVEETTISTGSPITGTTTSVQKVVKQKHKSSKVNQGAFHIESDSSMEQEETPQIMHSYVTESGTRPFFNLSNTEEMNNRICLTFIRPSFVFAPCVDGMRNQHFFIMNLKEILKDLKRMKKRENMDDSEDESELLEKDFIDEQSDNKSVTIKTVDENTGKESEVIVKNKKHILDGPKMPPAEKTTIIQPMAQPQQKTIKKETVTETKQPNVPNNPKVTVTKKTTQPSSNLGSTDVADKPDDFIEQLKNTFDEGEIKKLINI